MSAALAYRRDIDGLRCFAVTSVVLFHAFPGWIPSGFAGVDVFFVISGYLIGGIIYREAREGAFSYREFYARRARRILPALLVVTTLTLAFGLLLLGTAEMMMLAASAQWSLIGASNIFFWRHIDYFSPTADQNPLLMTWSLGIEEQFYLLFPPLLLAVRKLTPRCRLAALSALCLASLVVSAWQALHQPLAGFYLLPARAWELGAGAALALAHADRTAARWRWDESNALAATGFTLMVASFFLFDSTTSFPGIAALAPVAGTILLIHTPHSFVSKRLLGAGLCVGVGLISYSWYLWHWPMLTLLRIAAINEPSAAAIVVTAGASLVAAYLTWRFIERPFRKRGLGSAATLVRYGLVLAAMLGMLALVRYQQAYPSRLPATVQAMEGMDENVGSCLSDFGSSALPPADRCHPAGAEFALLGDSHAASLAVGLREQVGQGGARLAEFTKPSCAPLFGYTRRSALAPAAAEECRDFLARAVAAITSDRSVRTVVLAGFWPAAEDEQVLRVAGAGFTPAPGAEALERGLARMIDVLQRSGRRVVVVQDVPIFDEDPKLVLLAREIPARNALHLVGAARPQEPARRPPVGTYARSRATVARLASASGAHLVDPWSQLCSSAGCEMIRDGQLLYRDRQHLSVAGARAIDWHGLGE